MSDLAENPYWNGHYAPVADEVTAFDLPIVGELPAELNGRYLRNGPNPIGDTDPELHWFVGDGMVHGIRLREGKAEWYRNRFVGSAAVSEHRGLPDIPGPNWNDSSGGPNTAVGGFAGTTWAMVEAGGCPVELTYELETIARNDFYGTLPGGFSAHPKFDPATGELHAMTYAWGQWLDHAKYVVVGTDGRVRRTVDIPMGMSMLHDMALTPTHALVFDQPCTVDLELAMAGNNLPFRWNPDHGNRVGLLPREGEADEIVWIDVPLGYAFHPMNAYNDDSGKVVVDLCNYDKMFADDTVGPLGDGTGRLERWELDPVLGTSSITVIDDRPNEFPTHRGSQSTIPYRYGYTVGATRDTTDGWPMIKHNLVSGERTEYHHGAGRSAGEFSFVARAEGVEEDDGWLLGFVHGPDSTDFVVMDAQAIEQGPIATVTLPQRVPLGFHGNWVSDQSVPPEPS